MAVYENTFPIPPKTWVLITPAAIAAGRLQCQGPFEVHLIANQSGTVPPAGLAGSLKMIVMDGISAERTIANLFPGGVAGGTTAFIWAWAENLSSIAVSYA